MRSPRFTESIGEVLNPGNHLPFFVALAEAGESDPAFAEATAGLVVLRAFDTWVEDGADGLSQRLLLHNIWKAVDAIPPGSPVRVPLAGAFQAITSANRVDTGAVAPHLIAYADSLETQGHWTLAREVYKTLLHHTQPGHDRQWVARARERMAVCETRLVAATAESAEAK